jgi:hypothetical protein
MNTAYLKLYAYNEKGECTDIQIIEINDGIISMKNAIGQPKPEKPTKDT